MNCFKALIIKFYLVIVKTKLIFFYKQYNFFKILNTL